MSFPGEMNDVFRVCGDVDHEREEPEVEAASVHDEEAAVQRAEADVEPSLAARRGKDGCRIVRPRSTRRRRTIVRVLARLHTVDCGPDDFGFWERLLREELLPWAQRQEGFEGALAMANPERSKAHIMSLWADEEAAAATIHLGVWLSELAATASSGVLASVESFEILQFELGSRSALTALGGLPGGDLPLDIRDDQPEPRGHDA